jgi:hypothetical protein
MSKGGLNKGSAQKSLANSKWKGSAKSRPPAKASLPKAKHDSKRLRSKGAPHFYSPDLATQKMFPERKETRKEREQRVVIAPSKASSPKVKNDLQMAESQKRAPAKAFNPKYRKKEKIPWLAVACHSKRGFERRKQRKKKRML